MSLAISPEHNADDFEGEFTLDQKIEVFISRVKGWQIQPAIEMCKEKIPNRGFAQLLIVSSYFEMLGKYLAGFIGEGYSRKYFKEGFLYTFFDLPEDEKNLLDAFYMSVRNGLYHVGMTSPNVIIYDGIPGSFGFHEETGAISLYPDRFVEDISIRFEEFAEELRNENNAELRANFKKRFEDDNTWKPRQIRADFKLQNNYLEQTK